LGRKYGLNHPFSVHQNDRFIKLCEYFGSKGLISFVDGNQKGRKMRFEKEGEDVVLELMYFSLLAHGGFTFDSQKLGIKLPGRGIHICINPDKSKPYIEDLLSNDREMFANHAEELFNSSIALYLGSLFLFEFLFPNTYIVALGRKTHELDLFGCINHEGERKYLLIETTIGYFKKFTDEGKEVYDRDSHNWHFKKAIFKKWTLEKIFSVDINLIYVTVRELNSLRDDNLIQTLLSKEENIKVVHFLPTENAFVDIYPNSDYVPHLLKDSLSSLKESIDSLL